MPLEDELIPFVKALNKVGLLYNYCIYKRFSKKILKDFLRLEEISCFEKIYLKSISKTILLHRMTWIGRLLETS